MASTDARPVPIKNTAFRAVFPILDNDGDRVTGAAGLDSEVSKDQGTFADCTNEATEIATSSGVYYLDLTSTEMNADCVAVIVKTSTTDAKTTVLVLYPQESGDIKVDVQSYGGTAGTFSSGRPEVNATHWAGTAVGSATVRSDLINIAGAAVSTSTAQLGVNVVNFGGSAGTFSSGRPETNASHWGGTAVASANVRSNLVQILGTAPTEGASGRLAGAFTTLLNVASPVFTTASVNQTGDNYARLGAPAGASLSADVAAVKTDTGNLVTRITSTLFSGITSLAQWLGMLAGKQAGDTTARTEIRATGAGSGTFNETTDSMEALRDRGDTGWTTATGFSTHSAADVWAVTTRLLTAGTNIVLAKGTGVTGFNDIAASDVWAVGTRTLTALPSIPSNWLTAAGIASDAVTELQAGLATTGDIADLATVAATVAKLDDTLEDDAGTYRFTTNALEQAPSGGGGGGTDWTADERTAIRTILGVPASGTTPDAPTAGALKVIDDFIDTEMAAVVADVAAVKAKTDNLPSDPADASVIAGLISALQTHGDSTWATATGFAVAGDIPTAEENADAWLARNIDGGGTGGRTVGEALAFLRNKWAVSGGTLTVYDTDDSTPLWTATVSTDPAGVPIVGNDPS